METRQRDIVFGIEKRVDLRPACLQQCGHSVLRDFLFLHGLCELPGNDLLDRLRLHLFEDAFLLEETINTGTYMLLTHRSNSLWRFRAVAKSSSGAARLATRCLPPPGWRIHPVFDVCDPWSAVNNGIG
jgi:hypothetical protein